MPRSLKPIMMHVIQGGGLSSGINRDVTVSISIASIAKERPRLPCLEQLPPRTWDALRAHGSVRHFKNGQAVFKEGASSPSVWIALAGMCTLSKGHIALDFVEPGQAIIVALLGDLNRDGSYPIAAHALGPSHLLEIPLFQCRQVFEAQTDARDYFLGQIRARFLFLQACRATQASSVPSRLAHILLNKQQALQSGLVTRRILGQMAGTSTESTIRILSNWQKCGLIEIKDRRLSVLNRSAMERIQNKD